MPSQIIELSKHTPSKFARYRIRTNKKRPNSGQPTKIEELRELRNEFVRHVNATPAWDLQEAIAEKLHGELIQDGCPATNANLCKIANRQVRRFYLGS